MLISGVGWLVLSSASHKHAKFPSGWGAQSVAVQMLLLVEAGVKYLENVTRLSYHFSWLCNLF
jgi:hypothetical protein